MAEIARGVVQTPVYQLLTRTRRELSCNQLVEITGKRHSCVYRALSALEKKGLISRSKKSLPTQMSVWQVRQ